MLYLASREHNHFRYRPPKHPQHDLALIRVKEPIIFSSTSMPICLPLSDKFPDERGIVYVAGWGLHHESTKEEDCTTGDKGPDPFSKCKFPFFMDNLGAGPFSGCLKVKSPSSRNKNCQLLYKMMKKRKGNNASFIDENYGRVNTNMYHISANSVRRYYSF